MPCSSARRGAILRQASIFRRCCREFLFWDRIISCCLGKSIGYRQLPVAATPSGPPPPSATVGGFDCEGSGGGCRHDHHGDADLVHLKISVLGDSQIGKTSFLMKYGMIEKDRGDSQMTGLTLMGKTQCVKGACISYSIWEVGGDEKSRDRIPIACKDSVAILFMFDLTSRCTLNSVISWYQQASEWNKTAIPILIGSKFDEFIQLPLDLQWTIASQARAYAKVLNATLFFSSATYNINVNKIFKFMTARLFNLPWTVERNLTVGEPIIDF